MLYLNSITFALLDLQAARCALSARCVGPLIFPYPRSAKHTEAARTVSTTAQTWATERVSGGFCEARTLLKLLSDFARQMSP